jgi:hypothetical protein
MRAPVVSRVGVIQQVRVVANRPATNLGRRDHAMGIPAHGTCSVAGGPEVGLLAPATVVGSAGSSSESAGLAEVSSLVGAVTLPWNFRLVQ